MSNAKHTPGPWETYGGVGVWAPSSKAVIAQASEPRIASQYVEHHKPRLGSPDFHEACANAELIAAAPDLLEVLTAMMEFWDCGTPVQPGALLVDDARAALAKARGDQP